MVAHSKRKDVSVCEVIVAVLTLTVGNARGERSRKYTAASSTVPFSEQCRRDEI